MFFGHDYLSVNKKVLLRPQFLFFVNIFPTNTLTFAQYIKVIINEF